MFVLSFSLIRRFPLCLSSSQLLLPEKRFGGRRRCRIQFPGTLIGSASVSTVAQAETQDLAQGQIIKLEENWFDLRPSVFEVLTEEGLAWPGLAWVGLVWMWPYIRCSLF